MRTHGNLIRWNDDRGFGFIAPANGAPELFVHISAFPRDGGRPRLNELISFETEPGRDGKPRAVRIMRAAQPSASPAAALRRRQPQAGHAKSRSRSAAGMLMLMAVVGVAAYSWRRFVHEPAAPVAAAPFAADVGLATEPPPTYRCDGRTHCSQMSSCEEATFFIRSCPGTQMDGDGDGVPCEQQFCH